MAEYKIYGLIEPTTKTIRYVGYTGQTLKRRLRNHLCEKHRNHRTNWFKSLKEKNQIPEIVLIKGNIATVEEAKVLEILTIKFYKEQGNKLVNGTEGGDGWAPMKGRKHTPETRKKMSISKLGNKNACGIRSEETRKKCSLANLARGARPPSQKGKIRSAKKPSEIQNKYNCHGDTQ